MALRGARGGLRRCQTRGVKLCLILKRLSRKEARYTYAGFLRRRGQGCDGGKKFIYSAAGDSSKIGFRRSGADLANYALTECQRRSSGCARCASDEVKEPRAWNDLGAAKKHRAIEFSPPEDSRWRDGSRREHHIRNLVRNSLRAKIGRRATSRPARGCKSVNQGAKSLGLHRPNDLQSQYPAPITNKRVPGRDRRANRFR